MNKKIFLFLISILFNIFVCNPSLADAAYTTSSLVLSLNLDENSGVSAYDTSGNNLNGTVSGNPAWASGNITFDGTDDRIIVNDNDSLDGPSFSYEVWFTMPDSGSWSGLSNSYPRLIDKADSGGINMFILKGSRKAGIFFPGTWSDVVAGTSTGPQLNTNAVLDYSTKYHIVFTYDNQAKSGKIYLNNVLVTSGTTSANYVPSAVNLAIGGQPGGDARNIIGTIHRVSVYNKTLSADEIAANYMEGSDYNLPQDPSAVSTLQSTTNASLSSVRANGTSTSIITVTANNYLGSPLLGKTVSLSSNRGVTDTITTVSETTDSSGHATFTVKSSTAGSPVFTATADGITVTDTETITFTDPYVTTTGVTYTSTLDSLSLKMDVAYNSDLSNAPIILVLHGYSGPFTGDDIIQRFAQKGIFAIKTYKRSFGGSGGIPDDSGREIYDFVDAVEYVKSHYSQYVDPTNINVVGYSGGGGNIYGLITKFPDYFRSANVFFGMSDYGYDDTYGWYNNGGTGYRTQMQTRIGGTPSQVRDNYYSRAHYLGAKNNPYTHIQLFTDTAEGTCPTSHVTQYTNISNAEEFTNVVTRTSDANTIALEMSESFGLSLSNWLSANAGSTQYTRNSSGYLDWTTNADSTHDFLFKKFDSLRNYDKTDHFKADFDFQVNERPAGSAVMFGFRNSTHTTTLVDSIGVLLLNNLIYARVDYNGTPLSLDNRTLQLFTTTLLDDTTYHITIEVNNSVVTTTLKDASLNAIETQTLNMDGAKGFDGVDSFGIYDYNSGLTGGMVGTFDNLSVSAWARWLHGYPQEGTAQEGDITAENYFVPDIVAGTWSQPVLLSADSMFIPGYIKTNPFYIILGNGNDQAGNLTYDISGLANSFSSAKIFRIEGLTGETDVKLNIYGLVHSANYYVIDDDLSHSERTILSATTDSSGTLQIERRLGSVHEYKIFTDDGAPTITSITSSNSSGAYRAGDTLHLEINFSEPVNATSSVSLLLNTTPARGCSFTVSNSATSSCDYVVQDGDNAATLNVASISGTIKDLVDNSMANFTPAANLSASKTIAIDTVAPAVSISSFPIVNNANKSATAISGTCSENGLPVSLDIGGITATPTCSSGAWSTTIDLHTLTDGTITANISQTDTAGNTGSNSLTSTKDTDGPAVTGLSNDSTPKKTKTWTWSYGEESATFRYAIDQVLTWTADGDFASTTTAIQSNGNGTYYLHVQAQDGAGNASEVATVSAILDNTPPVITVSGDNPATVAQDSTYTDDGATATDNIDSSVTVTASGTVDIATLGDYTITYNAADVAGNAATSVTRLVHVTDQTPPTISELSDDSTPRKTKTWAWSGEEGDTFRFAVDRNATTTLEGEYGDDTTATQAGGNGTYYLHVQSKDAAGNESEPVTIFAFLDNTAPTITITNPNTENAQSKILTAITSDGLLTMSITTGSVCDGSLIFVSYEDHTFSSESDNGKKICYKAIDTAANAAYQISEAIGGIDATPPSISELSDDLAPVKSKTWNWSGEAETTFRFAIDQNSSWTPIGIYGDDTTATQAGGNGTYYLHVQSKDAAGNESEAVTVSAVLDNTAPVITIAGDNPISIRKGSDYNDAGATATDNIDNDVNVDSDSNVNSDIAGDYTVIYVATDTAGNEASSVRAVTVEASGSGASHSRSQQQPGTASPAGSQAQMFQQIGNLKIEIARLQGLLGIASTNNSGSGGGGESGQLCVSLTKDLYYGLANDRQVRCLQNFLVVQGAGIYPEAKITGNFYQLTRAAVIRFQEKYQNDILIPFGLTHGNGFVGSKTRQVINRMIGSGQ